MFISDSQKRKRQNYTVLGTPFTWRVTKVAFCRLGIATSHCTEGWEMLVASSCMAMASRCCENKDQIPVRMHLLAPLLG